MDFDPCRESSPHPRSPRLQVPTPGSRSKKRRFCSSPHQRSLSALIKHSIPRGCVLLVTLTCSSIPLRRHLQAVSGVLGTAEGLDLRAARALADDVCSDSSILSGDVLLAFTLSRFVRKRSLSKQRSVRSSQLVCALQNTAQGSGLDRILHSNEPKDCS